MPDSRWRAAIRECLEALGRLVRFPDVEVDRLAPGLVQREGLGSQARQAVESAMAGTALPAAALGPATAAVELLELVLPLVTWRRLEAAKVATRG